MRTCARRRREYHDRSQHGHRGVQERIPQPPQGRSKAFSDSADGYARGEGGAIVIIKPPLQQALDDGDDIYAQILGTAVSQDGHTDGITVPRQEAQEAAIRTALQRAGLQPKDIGYVEAHGTGTPPVGDPIEMRALAGALTADRPATEPSSSGRSRPTSATWKPAPEWRV